LSQLTRILYTIMNWWLRDYARGMQINKTHTSVEQCADDDQRHKGSTWSGLNMFGFWTGFSPDPQGRRRSGQIYVDAHPNVHKLSMVLYVPVATHEHTTSKKKKGQKAYLGPRLHSGPPTETHCVAHSTYTPRAQLTVMRGPPVSITRSSQARNFSHWRTGPARQSRYFPVYLPDPRSERLLRDPRCRMRPSRQSFSLAASLPRGPAPRDRLCTSLSPSPPQRPWPISPPPCGIGGQPDTNHPTSPGHITLASWTLFAFRFCAKPCHQEVSWGREKSGEAEAGSHRVPSLLPSGACDLVGDLHWEVAKLSEALVGGIDRRCNLNCSPELFSTASVWTAPCPPTSLVNSSPRLYLNPCIEMC
jgi:hypothetical protein